MYLHLSIELGEKIDMKKCKRLIFSKTSKSNNTTRLSSAAAAANSKITACGSESDWTYDNIVYNCRTFYLLLLPIASMQHSYPYQQLPPMLLASNELDMFSSLYWGLKKGGKGV